MSGSGFLTGVVSVVDHEGNRVDTPNENGDHSPIELQLGSSMTAVKTTNGALTRVTIDSTGGGGGGGGGVTVAADTHDDFRALAIIDVPDGSVIHFKNPPGTYVYESSLGAGEADDDETILKLDDVSPGSNGRAYSVEAPIVPTMAALRLAVSGKNKTVQTQCYRTAGDGGGGIFDDVTGVVSASDDGGMIVQAGGRLFQRRHAGEVDPRHYGMVADGQMAFDAAITAGTNSLSSASSTFVVGMTVLLPLALKNPIPGTWTAVSGSKALAGASSPNAEENAWENMPVSFLGHADTGKATSQLTGTVAYTSGSGAWVGTGTKFLTETHIGAILWVRGGTNSSSAHHPLCFWRFVTAIADDTHLTVNAPAPNDTFNNFGAISAAKMHWVWRGDATAMASTTAAKAKMLVDPAPTFSASGLTVYGLPKPLVAVVSAVSGGGHTATLSTNVGGGIPVNADYTLSGALACFGTGNDAAFTSLVANNDHIHIGPAVHGGQIRTTSRYATRPGIYVFAGSPTIPGTLTNRHISWSHGATLAIGDSFRVNAPACRLEGPSWGQPVGGVGQGTNYNYRAHILYMGPPRQPALWIADGSSVTAAGTGVEGLLIQQMCDYPTNTSDLAYDNTGGVVGIELGTRGATGAANNCFTVANVTTIDCEDGMLVNGGCQVYELRSFASDRSNAGQNPQFTITGTRTGTFTVGETVTQATSGATGIVVSTTSTKLVLEIALQNFDLTHTITGGSSGATMTSLTAVDYLRGPYSCGVGLWIAVWSRYVGGAACTAGFVSGSMRAVSGRTGVQIGNPYGGQVATTHIKATFDIEGMHPLGAAYVRIMGCGFVSFEGLHCENAPVVVDHSCVAVQLGSPITGGTAQQVTLKNDRFSTGGGAISIAAYQWSGGLIEGNLLDNQDNAANEAMFFADLSGGAGVRRNMRYPGCLDNGGGVNNVFPEIWPNYGAAPAVSGFIESRVFDIDAAGVLHPKHYSSGDTQLDLLQCPTFTGTKDLVGATVITGSLNIGDDQTSTTVTGNSLAGQKTLIVGSTTNLRAGMQIDIAPGLGAGFDELPVIDKVVNSTTLLLKTNLLYNHMAVDAHVVIIAPTPTVRRGSHVGYTPNGGGPTEFIDSYYFTLAAKNPALTGSRNKFLGIFMSGSFWDSSIGTPAAVARTAISRVEQLTSSPFVNQWYNEFNGNPVWTCTDDGVFCLGSQVNRVGLHKGSGSPEGVVTDSPGSLHFDRTNGEVYIKNTGTGNTGWKLITHA